MRRILSALVVFAAVAASGTGCGILFNGRTQSIPVQTVPANATVTVDTEPGNSYVAPTRIELSRDEIHMISAVRDGYEPASVSVVPNVDGVIVAVDCLLWWCIPLLWDWPLGAIHELSPSVVTVVLPEARVVEAPPVASAP